jgi:hypothetical protein
MKWEKQSDSEEGTMRRAGLCEQRFEECEQRFEELSEEIY